LKSYEIYCGAPIFEAAKLLTDSRRRFGLPATTKNRGHFSFPATSKDRFLEMVDPSQKPFLKAVFDKLTSTKNGGISKNYFL